jgi:hypothetical protein
MDGQQTGRSPDEPRRARVPIQSRIPSPDEPHRTTCAVYETEGHWFESSRARFERCGKPRYGPEWRVFLPSDRPLTPAQDRSTGWPPPTSRAWSAPTRLDSPVRLRAEGKRRRRGGSWYLAALEPPGRRHMNTSVPTGRGLPLHTGGSAPRISRCPRALRERKAKGAAAGGGRVSHSVAPAFTRREGCGQRHRRCCSFSFAVRRAVSSERMGADRGGP